MRAASTVVASSSPSARELRNTASAPGIASSSGAVEGDLRRKGRAVGIAGDRADVDARGDELGDEGAADVAGGARDENRKHVIKDGTGAQKVTVRGA